MRLKKIISNLMCATLILSNILTATASNIIVTENLMDDIEAYSDEFEIQESNIEEIEVTYTRPSKYSVIIPKSITLDSDKQANYSVQVTGDIAAYQKVYVAPIDKISNTENVDFYMQDTSAKKDDVPATIIQNKIYWDYEEVSNSYEETSNLILAPDLTAGAWKGTFEMEIQFLVDKDHEHGYVNGVCGCGKIDPNHEHDYEDYVCTICGDIDPTHEHDYEDYVCNICGDIAKHAHNYVNEVCTYCGEKQDEYYIAPADAIKNWNYTLDIDSGIVTLNYYQGSETDVIVYGNYVVDGGRYKTQIRGRTMFSGEEHANCKNIQSIIFSKDIDTNNVTNMASMFNGCSSLKNLDLSMFDTSNVTSMDNMFTDCSSLTSLDVSNFNTSNVMEKHMTCIFQNCSSLTILDLTSFDFRIIRSTSIFENCSNMKAIYVTRGMWSNYLQSDVWTFHNCGVSSVTYKD